MSAHYIRPHTDCMGSPVPGYWREFRECTDGESVMGRGVTPEEAEAKAKENFLAHEAMLTLPKAERLRLLVKGELLDTDQRAAIRLLAELILNRET